jgi:hypothetical protein
MQIHLNQTKKFFLTYQNDERKNHMLSHFEEIVAIESPAEQSRFKSGALGYRAMVLEGIRSDGGFKPFMMLEDDVAKYREFPSVLEVPDDADLLYVGLSSWGLPEGKINGQYGIVEFFSASLDVIRITNMLSTHGIMVCSQKGADKILEALQESYHQNIGWDIPITKRQKEINAYALKIPLVYQAKFLGGQESATKIECREFKDGEKTVIFLV